jgi:hypothetical protein
MVAIKGGQEDMVKIGSEVIIHGPLGSWDGIIVGTDWDSLDAARAVFLVSYGSGGRFEFYRQADSQGRHYQPGNADYWMEQGDRRG